VGGRATITAPWRQLRQTEEAIFDRSAQAFNSRRGDALRVLLAAGVGSIEACRQLGIGRKTGYR
jgi:hypothetical protein